MSGAITGSGGAFDEARRRITPPDGTAAAGTRGLVDRLTKPPGSLGRLEALAVRLSAMYGESPPPVPEPATVAVFAGDHGVLAEGVTPWPAEVTAQMVANFLSGGAAVNVFARHSGASVVVVDVGVAAELPDSPARPGAGTPGAGTPGAGTPGAGTPSLIRAKVRPGTANLAEGPAMTMDEARQALDVGATVAADLVAGGSRCLLTGDMGIGNTTPSAALIAAFTGRTAAEVTGRGTGIDDEHLARKVSAVERALVRTTAEQTTAEQTTAEQTTAEQTAAARTGKQALGGSGEAGRGRAAEQAGAVQPDPLAILASLGGLEIAALAGYMIAGAAHRVPVVVDGVIALAAAVTASALAPGCTGYMIAGHRSTEPGATIALDHLGLAPLVDLEMRLGEGTGACLALPLVQAAAKMAREMATFDAAGVTGKSG